MFQCAVKTVFLRIPYSRLFSSNSRLLEPFFDFPWRFELSGVDCSFVKGFNFVWCEVGCSCQECVAAVAVSARQAVSMAKSAVRLPIGWCVVWYVNVMSSECRPIWWVNIYGICLTITIASSLRQFNRRPSWFVHQWK